MLPELARKWWRSCELARCAPWRHRPSSSWAPALTEHPVGVVCCPGLLPCSQQKAAILCQDEGSSKFPLTRVLSVRQLAPRSSSLVTSSSGRQP